MKRPILLFGLAIALTIGWAVRAQVTLDVSNVTCGQFVTYKITNPKFIAIWLNGYYHGTRGSIIVDTGRLEENAQKVTDYCIKNPEALLMKAVEALVEPDD